MLFDAKINIYVIPFVDRTDVSSPYLRVAEGLLLGQIWKLPLACYQIKDCSLYLRASDLLLFGSRFVSEFLWRPFGCFGHTSPLLAISTSASL
jgi:hypothetical protein